MTHTAGRDEEDEEEDDEEEGPTVTVGRTKGLTAAGCLSVAGACMLMAVGDGVVSSMAVFVRVDGKEVRRGSCLASATAGRESVGVAD